MRKMFSKKQIEEMRDDISSSTIVSKIAGQDIAPEDITASGDLSVSGSINGEENPSVKPIYYHPIYMVGTISGSPTCRIQIAILDNNPTAYNATTGIAKIKALLSAGAIINANGYYVRNSVYCPVYVINKSEGTDYIYIHDASGRYEVPFDDVDVWGFVDGVNKIN